MKRKAVAQSVIDSERIIEYSYIGSGALYTFEKHGAGLVRIRCELEVSLAVKNAQPPEIEADHNRLPEVRVFEISLEQVAISKEEH